MNEYTCTKCGHQTYTIYCGGCPMCGTPAPIACLLRAHLVLERLAKAKGCTVEMMLAEVASSESEIGYGYIK